MTLLKNPLRNHPPMYKPMGMDSTFKFGKHVGEQVEDVIEDDREYIVFLIEAKDWSFDEEVLERIEKTRP